jgi:hypothetical protein
MVQIRSYSLDSGNVTSTTLVSSGAKSPEDGIRDLAALYVEEVEYPGGAPCTEGSPYCRCRGSGESRVCLTEPHTRYDRRGDLDVMDILGFSDEEKRQALFMGTVETP